MASLGFVSLGFVSPAGAAPATTVRMAVLDGAQIGPTGADADGSGAFVIHFADNAKKVCWGLTVRDIDKPTAIRIHKGAVGASGPVVQGFKILPSTGDVGAAAGCVPPNAAVLDGLRASPSDFYIEVATKASPDGAIRGQLGLPSGPAKEQLQ